MDGLHDLRRPEGSHRDRKRLGRGPGSGQGKTAGFGHKGSKARAGHHGPGGSKPHFEGGQMPLQRRIPKFGFKNPFSTHYRAINLARLSRLIEAGTIDPSEAVTPDVLVRAGVARKDERVKVLAAGELSHPLNITAHAFSASARQKIEAAGGSANAVEE